MPDEALNELPIYDLDAEKAIVSAMLIAPVECCQIVVDSLQESDFFVKSSRSLFILLSAMWSQNKPIDLLTVKAEAKDGQLGDELQTMWELADTMGAFMLPSSLSGYIQIVKEKAKAREYQSIGFRLALLAQSHDDGDEKDRQASALIKRLDEIAIGSKVEVFSGPKPWEDFYASMAKPESDATGDILTTGYGHLDAAVKMRGGHVIVIAAVQKHGKSSLAFNITARWWQQQIPGTACSLEMGLSDLQVLIMSNATGIPRDHFEDRRFSESELANLFQSTARAQNWPYAIFERPSLKAREFRALAREQSRKGHKFIVLDYFQLMQTDRQGYSDNRAADLEEMMRTVKCTALETGMVVILLSQINTKQVEGREGNRPSLAHLRGTGAIAQDADVIMLLSEPKPESRVNGMRQLVCDITNRRGAEKQLNWLLDGAHARFIEG